MTTTSNTLTVTTPTDALSAMRGAMENALEYRSLESANDGDAYYRSMADREQKRAIMLAQCAQAEMLASISHLLESIALALVYKS